MQIRDLKKAKNTLREKYRAVRSGFSPEQKLQYDRAILAKLVSLYQYKNARTVLTYVSKDIEVDTLMLIEKALSDGKKVAVPRCVEGTRLMEFYLISSLSQLESGCFGVLEPDVSRCRMLVDMARSICVVPGMSFDTRGYRLGYGKGYYDRFLQGYNGVTVGICYSDCVKWKLPTGKYDKPVDILVTEKYFRRNS